MRSRFRTPEFRSYLLLQLPDILVAGVVLGVLHRWLGLPLWVALLLFVLWVVKDIAPYPWLADALERPATAGPESLVGARGTALEALDPVGYVRIGGELWRATILDRRAIPAGAAVRVQEVRGLTLVVMPAPAGDDGASEESEGAH